MLLVVQIILKIIAFTYAERILLRASSAARLSLTPMMFVGKLARRFDMMRSRLAGEEIRPEKEELEEDLIGQIREGERDGWIDSDEAKMARAVFRLKEKDAASEMTPRTDIVMTPSDASVRDALTVSNESGHSRLPVYQDTRDNVVGVFYVKDAVASLIAGNDIDSQRVTEMMRTPFFVPDTKRLDGLLEKMQQNKTHTAIILDEYGGTAGLITLEDILEEVIGDVVDEYDADEPDDYQIVSDNELLADGKTHLDDITDAFGIKLPESDEFDTIAGYVVSVIGHIPAPGETMDGDGFRVEVLEADDRRVLKVKITKPMSE
mgnify:CR=1 FL=1